MYHRVPLALLQLVCGSQLSTSKYHGFVGSCSGIVTSGPTADPHLQLPLIFAVSTHPNSFLYTILIKVDEFIRARF